MRFVELKKIWKNNYANCPLQLQKMSEVKSVVTAFNINIDAVVKLDSNTIKSLAKEFGITKDEALSASGQDGIKTNRDVALGIIKCFASGNAEEWLINDENVFKWIKEKFGSDKLQMGGQGGVVANAMAVCGVQKVYAHCASLPKEQAELFIPYGNIVSADENGNEKKTREINRKDLPLIHWILEFDGKDSYELNGENVTCPKSNRFIATYDPLNFRLHIDEAFIKIADENDHDYVILSGYHLLKEKLTDSTSGFDCVEKSRKILKGWVKGKRKAILHLEVASTQDLAVRSHIVKSIIKDVDSIGVNDREAIDILNVIGETELAKICDENISADNMFRAIYRIFQKTACPRIQLHMYGIYITLQKKGFPISPLANRNGMQLASMIASAKAGTGSIENPNNLLWAKDLDVSDVGLTELERLTKAVEQHFGKNNLMTEGIYTNDEIEIIAIPTILVEKPLTLVGMGDTISSISLVAAR